MPANKSIKINKPVKAYHSKELFEIQPEPEIPKSEVGVLEPPPLPPIAPENQLLDISVYRHTLKKKQRSKLLMGAVIAATMSLCGLLGFEAHPVINYVHHTLSGH